MNKKFKLVWNDDLQQYVVVSELAKSKSRIRTSIAGAILLSGMIAIGSAAVDDEYTIVAGETVKGETLTKKTKIYGIAENMILDGIYGNPINVLPGGSLSNSEMKKGRLELTQNSNQQVGPKVNNLIVHTVSGNTAINVRGNSPNDTMLPVLSNVFFLEPEGSDYKLVRVYIGGYGAIKGLYGKDKDSAAAVRINTGNALYLEDIKLKQLPNARNKDQQTQLHIGSGYIKNVSFNADFDHTKIPGSFQLINTVETHFLGDNLFSGNIEVSARNEQAPTVNLEGTITFNINNDINWQSVEVIGNGNLVLDLLDKDEDIKSTAYLSKKTRYTGDTIIKNGIVTGGFGRGNIEISETGRLNAILQGDANIEGSLKGDGHIHISGKGTFSLRNAENNMKNIEVVYSGADSDNSNSILEVHEGATLNVADTLKIGQKGRLSIDVGEKSSIHAGTLVFEGNDTGIILDGYNERENSILVTTTNGVMGDYKVFVGGQELKSTVTEENFLYGTVETIGNDIINHVGLVWNANNIDAHGFFNLHDDCPLAKQGRFYVNTVLADQIVVPGNRFDWDGKTLTKLGTGTLVLNAENTYTGGTVLQEGGLLIGEDEAHNYAFVSSDILATGGKLGGFGLVKGSVALGENSTLVSDLGLTIKENLDSSATEILLNEGANLTVDKHFNVNGTKLDLTMDAKVNAKDMTLANSGIMQLQDKATLIVQNNMTIAESAELVVNKESTFDMKGKLSVTDSGILSIDTTNDSPLFTAGSIDFAEDAVLNLISYETYKPKVLIKTNDGVTGDYKISVAGHELKSFVTEEMFEEGQFLYGHVTTEGNDIVSELDLVWNSESEYAHGAFNVDNGADYYSNPFRLNSSLTNQEASKVWDGQSLTKTGEGTLILNAQNSYTGDTNVNAGTLIIGDQNHQDARITSNVAVNQSGTLAGFGTILGNVAVKNGGTLFGDQLTVSGGNVNLEDGSTTILKTGGDYTGQLLVKRDAAGNGGQLIIDNGASLVVNAADGDWSVGTKYILATADAGIVGEFNNQNVQSDQVFINHKVQTIGNYLVLGLERNDVSIGGIGQTPNEVNVGNALNNSNIFDPIYEQVVLMNHYQAQNALNALSGEIYASAKAAMLNNSQYSRDSVYDHLRTTELGALNGQRELWADMWGHTGDLKASKGASKMKNEGYGVLIGSDIYSTNVLRFGAAVGYEENKLKVNNLSSKADTKAFHLMGYGQAIVDQFEFSGGLGYSFQDIDVQRNVSIGNLYSHNSAKYDANVFQVFAKGQYYLPITEAFEISPYMAATYQHLKTDDKTESGYITNLMVKGGNEDLISTYLGTELTYKFNNKSELFADIAWRYNSKESFSNTMTMTNMNSFEVNGASIGRNVGVVSFGGMIKLNSKTRLSFGYEGEFSGSANSNSVKLQFQYNY